MLAYLEVRIAAEISVLSAIGWLKLNDYAFGIPGSDHLTDPSGDQLWGTVPNPNVEYGINKDSSSVPIFHPNKGTALDFSSRVLKNVLGFLLGPR